MNFVSLRASSTSHELDYSEKDDALCVGIRTRSSSASSSSSLVLLHDPPAPKKPCTMFSSSSRSHGTRDLHHQHGPKEPDDLNFEHGGGIEEDENSATTSTELFTRDRDEDRALLDWLRERPEHPRCAALLQQIMEWTGKGQLAEMRLLAKVQKEESEFKSNCTFQPKLVAKNY